MNLYTKIDYVKQVSIPNNKIMSLIGGFTLCHLSVLFISNTSKMTVQCAKELPDYKQLLIAVDKYPND